MYVVKKLTNEGLARYIEESSKCYGADIDLPSILLNVFGIQVVGNLSDCVDHDKLPIEPPNDLDLHNKK